MKLLSLFSGIGAFEKALDKLGCDYELVNYCEYDKYASKAYSAIHGVSESLNLWDVRDVDTSKLPKDIDLITYGFPCVPKGYLVRTSEGFKPIETIKEDEEVLTHKNRFRKVIRTMNRVSDHIYHITGEGVADLQLTDEHPVYVFKGGKFTWVKVKDLKVGDEIVYNINNREVKSEYTDSQLWLIGRFVACGHINRESKNIVFIINEKDKINFESHLDSSYILETKVGNLEYTLDKSYLNGCFDKFIAEDYTKIIPSWVLDLPKEQLICFLDGFFGDYTSGRSYKDTFILSLSNKHIGSAIQEIGIKLWGTIPTTTIRKVESEDTYSDVYEYHYTPTNANEVIGDKIAVKIESITREELPIEVFNLEVDEDNSYCVENIIVHNCQDISIAGEQKGFTNEDGTSTRSGLFYEALRIIESCKPKVAIAENVKNLVSKKFENDFRTVLKSLEDVGYNNYWKVLNTKDFGIPQNRERVFIVSIRKDIDRDGYKFPSIIPLDKRLKDLLEDEVDEKYYISDSMINYLTGVNQKPCKYNRGERFKAAIQTPNCKGIANTLSTSGGSRPVDNFILEPDTETDKILHVGRTRGGGQRADIIDEEGISSCLTATDYKQPKQVFVRNKSLNDTPNIEEDISGENFVIEPSKDISAGKAKLNDMASSLLGSDGNIDYRIRKLTPKECFRLQGFDDKDWEKASKVNSDSQLYKRAGNSITVDVLVYLMKDIITIINNSDSVGDEKEAKAQISRKQRRFLF